MSEKALAPILVSVYHRLDCLQRCIESLLHNPEAKESEIWIVSDAAFKPEHDPLICQVRDYIRSIRGFRAVHPVFHEENQGAGFSVIPKMHELLERYGKIIQMEDDIVAAPDYLRYLNDGLEFYENDKRVQAICAFKFPFKLPSTYKYDFYPLVQMSPWGNATWRDRIVEEMFRSYDRYAEMEWLNPELFQQLQQDNPNFMSILKSDSEGLLNAWDARQEYYLLMHSKVCIYPCISRSQNWGFDSRSDHCTELCGVVIPELADSSTPAVAFKPLDEIGGVSVEITRRFLGAYKVQPLLKRIVANVRWFGLRRTLAFYVRRLQQKLGVIKR